MKPFIVFAALVAASQASPLQGVSDSLLQSVVRAKWSAFKSQHGKQYANNQEESLRLSRYLEATKMIEEHNARYHAGLESFEMGHNEFSDLSLQELKTTKMGVSMPSNVHEIMANATVHIPSAGYNAPKDIDWRTWSGVQKVKNQGSCGSCYAFSAMGALETAYWRKYNTLLDLSEQQAVDCVNRQGTGCGGGWMHNVFQWVQNNGGIANQASYPYTARSDACRAVTSKVAPVAKFTRISDEAALLNAVATVGTVSVAYNAGTTQHAYYKQGILDIPNCGTTPTHAVLLVGYGTENNVDYWLLKNSWGSNWGEKGFFRIRRGGNQCGIASWSSYPIAQ